MSKVINVLENLGSVLKATLVSSIEKASISIISNLPYLNTTTSKQVENTKAFEWTIIKELGKLTRVTSGEGGPAHLFNIRVGSGGTEWCCTTV